MKKNIQKIKPFRANGKTYYADTCLPLVDAWNRKKVKLKALARYTYPGNRLTNDTKGLNSIGYWDAREAQDWGLDWHRNEGIEIHFLESGTMPYSQENGEMVLSANDLTITRPWEAHKVGNPNIGIGKFYWVILDVGVRQPHQEWIWPDWIMLSDGDLQRLTTILRQNEQPVWKANNEIRECFQKISRAVNTDRKGSNASKVRLYVNELLVCLLDLFDSGNLVLNESLTDSMRSARLFLDELNEKLSEPWTIEEMAKSAGLGLTRFTYHCKQLTNMTPMQYLTIKRLEKARKLLKREASLSIAEIAYRCGFATSQYFSTVFKKYEKCSPQQYRGEEALLTS